jgi:predicted RNase H-like HicB family nuclease
MERGRRARQYAVVIEAAGAAYSAYVPDLPGCIATGDSLEQVTDNIRIAIEMHFDGLQEDGFSIPEPSTRTISVVVAA